MKPKTGYSWACATCSKEHDEEVDNYTETGAAPRRRLNGANASAKAAKAAKAVVPSKGKEREGQSSCFADLHWRADEMCSRSESGYDANYEWLAFSVFRDAH